GEIVVKAFFKGQLLSGTQVLVHAPIGWDKELKTDADGIVAFTPLWPGRYVLEIIHVEKTPGEFEGKSYEALRHRSTLALQVRAERSAEK
ncbi:MAG: nickel transport complex, NikM subunit,transmembrane, partial [Nitrospira sp.]